MIDKQVFAGKVFSVSVLTRDTACNVQETYVVASGPNGIILLWQLISRDSCVQVLHKGLFELPYCRQRWLAAAALVCPKDHGPQLQIGLIVGDRRGSIHVFDVEDRANEAAQVLFNLLYLFTQFIQFITSRNKQIPPSARVILFDAVQLVRLCTMRINKRKILSLLLRFYVILMEASSLFFVMCMLFNICCLVSCAGLLRYVM